MSLIFQKINNGYESDPNDSDPIVSVHNNDLTLLFNLNCISYTQFTRGQKGKIVFNDCLMFRVGDPNDEGFYIDPKNPSKRNDSTWNYTDFPDLKMYNFYCVENSDWQDTFGPHAFTNKDLSRETENHGDYKHYLFMMKDATFECIARFYQEKLPV